MSDILNHYRCGREVLSRLADHSKLKQICLRSFDAFRLGTQGPDFLYYALLPPYQSCSQELAKCIHASKTQLFFLESYAYIKDLYRSGNRKEADTVFSYLAGFTTHYCLDTRTHPMIFYKTGRYLGDRESRYYSYIHKVYEALLDIAMLEKFDSIPGRKIVPQKVFALTKQTEQILGAYYRSIASKVYDLTFPRKAFSAAIKQAREINRWTLDPSHLKERLLLPIEKAVGEPLVLTRLFYREPKEVEVLLNLNHNLWLDPTTGEEHWESYPDLFKASVDESVQILSSLPEGEEILQKNLDFLQKLYRNLSFLTGISVDSVENFRFFNPIFENVETIHKYTQN